MNTLTELADRLEAWGLIDAVGDKYRPELQAIAAELRSLEAQPQSVNAEFLTAIKKWQAEPPRTWLLWFDDKDCVDEVFTDYGAARKRYETCSASWSCTLFASIVGRAAEPVRDTSAK